MKHDGGFMEIVASFEDEYRAEAARVRLLVANIPCEIAFASSFNWNPWAVKIPGAYSVLVKRSHFIKARKLLNH